jgi:hypothetical protein
MTFLAVYDSYMESFHVALPCMYVLQPDLIHLLYFSSFYFSPFLMAVYNIFKWIFKTSTETVSWLIIDQKGKLTSIISAVWDKEEWRSTIKLINKNIYPQRAIGQRCETLLTSEGADSMWEEEQGHVQQTHRGKGNLELTWRRSSHVRLNVSDKKGNWNYIKSTITSMSTMKW